jgi:competence protein ComEC
LTPLPLQAGPHPDANPDSDGVALAAATALGVLAGTRVVPAAAWVAVAAGLAAACLATARSPGRAGRPVLAGVLVLGTLFAAGAAAASVRAAAVRGAVLPGRAGQPGRVEVTGSVAEEPRPVRFGGHWVVLTIDRVQAGAETIRTRERAGLVLSRDAPTGPSGSAPMEGRRVAEGQVAPEGRIEGEGPSRPGGQVVGQGRLAVGDRVRVRGSVAPARWPDALGRRPVVVLRHPVVQERAPPPGVVLRASEAVRDAARRQALATLAPERAGLLVGMALGDTSLLPAELEHDFRAAGLTHLMAVSGANLAVVLAVGLWLAGAAGAQRGALAAVGVALVALLVVVTRWEPSVLRAGVMAVLVLLGLATGRGPGGRRALCLAVVALLLADPALAGALGFHLSVAATAGVLWLGPLAARALPGWLPERARKAAGITLGAQAAAVPALALALGPVSLAGLPANLLGLPLAGGPMLLGVAAAATAPVAPWAASLACRLADPFLLALIAVARWAAALPGGSMTLGGPARAVPALAMLLLLAALLHRRRPYLPGSARLPIDPERTASARHGHRQRVPQGGPVPARGGGARDLGTPDVPDPRQAVRHPLR